LVTPGTLLVAELGPFNPKGFEVRGRLPISLEKMLRMHVTQQTVGISDEAIDETMYNSILFGKTCSNKFS